METVTDSNAVQVSQSTLTYDARDRLTQRSDPTSNILIDQSWDADGNRISQTINGQARTFTYDARDRLVTLEQPGAPDGQGCPNVAGAGCAGAIPLIRYDYDSQGLRTKKTQGPAETRYQYDQGSLIAETNAIGNPTSRLHYGATQLLARTEAGSTPTHRNYLLDALKSPIVLTDNDGAISARTRYDAWGEIRAQQGTTGTVTTPNANSATAELLTTDQQPIGFTGYQKDEESGLYYAKARYYDPTVARFTSEDPEQGEAMTPPSLHRYLYAYGNPGVYWDPNGRCGGPAGDMSECAQMYAAVTGDDSIVDTQNSATEIASERGAGMLFQMGSDAVQGTIALASTVSDAIGAQFENLTGYRGFGYAARTETRVQSLGNTLGTFAGKVHEDPYDATIGAASMALTDSVVRAEELTAQGRNFESGQALSGPASALLISQKYREQY